MFTMCSFEKAWRPKKLSPWCSVFSKEDLEVLHFLYTNNKNLHGPFTYSAMRQGGKGQRECDFSVLNRKSGR